MIQVPAETLSMVFNKLVTLELGRMPLVSREWNQILSDTTSLWWNVEFETRDNNEWSSLRMESMSMNSPITSWIS